MDGRRLILMDGTTIENGTAGYADAHLWCRVSGFTMPQAAQIFLDPAKTGRITFEYGEMSDVYDGFTNCTSIFIDADGIISACMVRGDG